ncbi:hypothetical protein IGI37_001981 [Enterococcus sp. AZ194]|uniref:helix-turn-helix domain-containing protein n=1 Tax=Enterococcus sp. AZ194 TaxID=2774629 RepID=UPI003F2604CE
MAILFEHRVNEALIQPSKELDFPPHLHNEVEVVVVTSGTITLKNEGQLRQIHQGQAAVVFSNCIHEYYAETTGEMLMYIISPQLIPEFAPLFLNKLPIDFVIDISTVETQISMIGDYLLEHGFNQNERLTQAYLHLFFALLLDHLILKPRPKSQSLSTSAQVIRYISEHFTEPITLQDIAQEIGCSVYTVSRIFSDKIKIGFRNYLNQMRVDYSRKLLRETDWKILEIALECGFESLRSFNRAYMKAYGQSPRVYRQEN